MSHVRFDDRRPTTVTAATFELYHLYSDHPGWDLEVELDGEPRRLSLTGTGARPALPGPSRLDVAYVDRPACAVQDGALELVAVGPARVRVTGTLHSDRGAITVDVEAALVT